MKIKLMLAAAAVVLVGLAGAVEAGPSNDFGPNPNRAAPRSGAVRLRPGFAGAHVPRRRFGGE
jgi:hypothetical protein